MDIIEVDVPRLRLLAQRLETLMKQAKGADERDPLDYLLGGLHGLLLAKHLGFKDRDHALEDPRGRSSAGVEYWEYGPLERVRLMSAGKLRCDGAWVAGFYFNSALARLAAVFDRAVRRKAIQKGFDVDTRPAGSGPPPTVWKLLSALGLDRFKKGELAKVYEEVNPLKHKPAGLAKRRNVSMVAATAAFAQMLELLEHRNMR